mmetsp:Transcript_33446/g.61714  ORF Transcript_33446/g.61714 Transcript_33446/m.61714 type:complete len:281 (-) Transcript_33446:559-1401(-)
MPSSPSKFSIFPTSFFSSDVVSPAFDKTAFKSSPSLITKSSSSLASRSPPAMAAARVPSSTFAPSILASSAAMSIISLICSSSLLSVWSRNTLPMDALLSGKLSPNLPSPFCMSFIRSSCDFIPGGSEELNWASLASRELGSPAAPWPVGAAGGRGPNDDDAGASVDDLRSMCPAPSSGAGGKTSPSVAASFLGNVGMVGAAGMSRSSLTLSAFLDPGAAGISAPNSASISSNNAASISASSSAVLPCASSFFSSASFPFSPLFPCATFSFSASSSSPPA